MIVPIETYNVIQCSLDMSHMDIDGPLTIATDNHKVITIQPSHDGCGKQREERRQRVVTLMECESRPEHLGKKHLVTLLVFLFTFPWFHTALL